MKSATAPTPATDTTARYKLFGSIGSPYALKLRSLMRYKRLPFDWMPATLDWIPEDLPHPPLCDASNRKLAGLTPRVVPAVYLPGDGSIRNESTTLAYLLDERHPERGVVPKDPVVAFCSDLLEDMADEWLVKIAFLYRWGNDLDAAYKSRIVTGEFLGGNYPQALFEKAAKHFASRQQSRMPLVGATTENAALILMSFGRLLSAMNRISEKTTFIFGDAPTLADFGFYGQLQSLATDPTPWTVMRQEGLGVFPYLQLLEDASGIEPTNMSMAALSAGSVELLRLAAEVYLPYLRANDKAVAANEQSFALEVKGLRYMQAPFKYHAKCYRILREKFAALQQTARSQVEATLGSVELLS
ncbi:glutathione S-transferase N-terminal domain-containing protein [Bradyrhizobium cenepequi]|uniref:glutathione S-transferase N-terminal domain-containing protein n=1 Tax=Bradyrhizobium cenepequi TaxID=2821403 RepID=UPI001CE39FB1|nr:glutathione S-transferase C-terminal domain-containing protein [Bradyrhizobium cenepequi]MCA6112677.1 glutathione S-transferase family protein [Bradyrhizobium cenepequi]